VILSACSSFFRNILRRLPHHHPLIYLRGIKLSDLNNIINFMYHGQVNVAKDDLSSFLALAEDLKVKGLTQQCNNQDKTNKPSSSCPPHLAQAPGVKRKSPTRLSSSASVSSVSERANTSTDVTIKTEAEDEDYEHENNINTDNIITRAESPHEHVFSHEDNNHMDYHFGSFPPSIGISESNNKVEVLIKEESIDSLNPDDELERMSGDMFKCRLCHKSLDCLDTAKNHILAHFALPGGLTCLQCGLSFNSRVLFGVHMGSEHRNIKKW